MEKGSCRSGKQGQNRMNASSDPASSPRPSSAPRLHRSLARSLLVGLVPRRRPRQRAREARPAPRRSSRARTRTSRRTTSSSSSTSIRRSRTSARARGTLLSDRLVLTARHCVADTDESAACDVTGTPLAQGEVRGNHPANTLYVFVGPNRPDFTSRNITPDGVGAQDPRRRRQEPLQPRHRDGHPQGADPEREDRADPPRLADPQERDAHRRRLGRHRHDAAARRPAAAQRASRSRASVPTTPTALPVPAERVRGRRVDLLGRQRRSRARGTQRDRRHRLARRQRDASRIRTTRRRAASAARTSTRRSRRSRTSSSTASRSSTPIPGTRAGRIRASLKPGAACTDGSECRSNLCLADPSQRERAGVRAGLLRDRPRAPRARRARPSARPQVCRRPRPSPRRPPRRGRKTTTTSGCSTAPSAVEFAWWLALVDRRLGLVLAALGLAALRRRRA